MSLSDRERKLLEELEKSLGEGAEPGSVNDTPFLTTAKGPRRTLLGLLISVAGFAALVFAVVSRVSALGLVAFLTMGCGLVIASSRKKQ